METIIATAAALATFQVLVSKRERLESTLAALAKRAARKGLPALTWKWGKAYTVTEIKDFPAGALLPANAKPLPYQDTPQIVRAEVTISRIPLEIPAAPVKFAGWTFVATLQHIDRENIVRTVPGQTCPETYRTRGPQCDHCKAARRRNDTFVVRHEDGRTLQVGSTCIADFLGDSSALAQAQLATYLSEIGAAGADGEDDGGGYGGGCSESVLSDFLPIVAWEVRTNGWMSRTAARERALTCATADVAWTLLNSDRQREKAGCKPTAEDIQKAEEAAAWAENLTDAEVSGETGDYLHNIRAIGRSGLVSFKLAGLAASIVTAYERAMGRKRQQAERAARPKTNEYVGTVGKRESFQNVVLDFVAGYDTQYGYTTVLKFRTPEGHALTWKASSTNLSRADVGKRFNLKGTIKKHEEYKGEKQTIVTRCNVEEVVPVAA